MVRMTEFDLRKTAAFAREGWHPHDLAKARADHSLDRVRRSVYATPEALDADASYRRDVAAAMVVRHRGGAVSHTSAASLHRLPLRQLAHGVVHLTREDGGHGHLRAGVRLHRAPLPPADVTEIDGIPVTTLERTVADLARIEPFEWGVAAADAALRNGADLRLLTEFGDQALRRPGGRRLMQVLSFADGRAESAAESLSRVSIDRAGLPAPILQFEVRDAWGHVVAVCDFGWPQWRVVGEMDGRMKYEGSEGQDPAEVILKEKNRQERIRGCGWWLTRWGWTEAVSHVRLGAQLRNAFRQAA